MMAEQPEVRQEMSKQRQTRFGLLLLCALVAAPGQAIGDVNAGEWAESEALNRKALVLFKQGDIDGAIKIWEQAAKLAIDPNIGVSANAEVLNNLGFAYYQRAKETGNQEDFKQARWRLAYTIRVDPHRGVAYRNLGDLYLDLEMPDHALYAYEMLLHLMPNYSQARQIKQQIQSLRERQAGSWKTHRTDDYTIGLPPGYTVVKRKANELEVVPPVVPKNCQPHCPFFLIITTHGADVRESLASWIKRTLQLESFRLFFNEGGGWRDCIEETSVGDGLRGFKVHEWVQAVGVTRYYVKRGDRVYEFYRAETGMSCQEHGPENWPVRQIMSSFRIKRPIPEAGKRVLQLYGPDDQAMAVYVQHVIAAPQNATLKDKLDFVAGELSRKMFKGLPIVVVDIKELKGQLVAHIDLREDEALRKQDARISWRHGYFQGTAGGAMTASTLTRTFLQHGYPGEWIEGVVFSYHGRPITEDAYEHLGSLSGLLWR